VTACLLVALWAAADSVYWTEYRFQSPEIRESSGIVRSRQYANLYWTHNDSGDSPRLFAIDSTGRLIGILPVRNAHHVDWEDIALDEQGNLYIADIGNNRSTRRDLGIYVVPEPNPCQDTVATAVRFIPLAYPDQRAFPAVPSNFDAEALWVWKNHLYVLTKRWGDGRTVLYRSTPLDEPVIRWERLDSLDIGGLVTAADLSPDGRRLAVLTYTAIWILEAERPDMPFLRRRSRRIPIAFGQSEGICFDADVLVLTNEGGQMRRLRYRSAP
jgi:hypothetical protein